MKLDRQQIMTDIPKKEGKEESDELDLNLWKLPPCGRYAERRRVSLDSLLSRYPLPPICDTPLGKSCKQGIHRNWEDGEREKIQAAIKEHPEKFDTDRGIIFIASVNGDVVLHNTAEARKHYQQTHKGLGKFRSLGTYNWPMTGESFLKCYHHLYLASHGILEILE